ncbi:MAG: hypothetical protein IT192_02575, partial [Microbacteriaceae bacterium]|nr:hypothetical protein [Microbacteriaceae bacterium]
IEQVAQLLVNFISGLTLAWLATRDSAAAARTMDFAADSIATLAEQSPAQSYNQPENPHEKKVEQ